MEAIFPFPINTQLRGTQCVHGGEIWGDSPCQLLYRPTTSLHFSTNHKNSNTTTKKFFAIKLSNSFILPNQSRAYVTIMEVFNEEFPFMQFIAIETIPWCSRFWKLLSQLMSRTFAGACKNAMFKFCLHQIRTFML